MIIGMKVSELSIACDYQTENDKEWFYVCYQPILLSLK